MSLKIFQWNTNNFSSLRKRFRDAESSHHNIPEFEIENKYEKSSRRLETKHFFGLLLFLLLIFLAVIVIEKRLPQGLTILEEPKNPDRFIAERAYNFLKNLTQLGPRIAGSYANEVEAVKLLTLEISDIIENAHENHAIEMDLQKTSGDFNLGFLDGLTNVYRNLQNIVVRFGSKNSTSSLLINCHFDSALDSPGASDDGAGCAVMLEILRVFSKSPKTLPHNIIFLFNGGEENFLPASHGFITQHKWSKEIRAFINLEACGAGGREFLFQAGPHHPWILETYSKEVPYPYASSAAKEIFQSGLIPADTDYRIFKDFGNVSGVDFAWSVNGYVYHTKFDTIEQVPLGSLQRTGDNILALVRGIAGSEKLADGEKYKEGDLLFFDVLGAFILKIPMSNAKVVSLVVVAMSLIFVYSNAQNTNTYILKPKYYFYKSTCKCMIGILGCWVVSILTNILIALVLTTFGKTMSWYARPWWVLFLYIVPAMFVLITGLLSHSKHYLNNKLSSWAKFQLYYDATQLIWTMIALLGLLAGTHFFAVALIWVLFASIGNFLKSRFAVLKDEKWLFFYTAKILFPFIQCSYWILALLYLFIPTMGRIGAGNHGEVIVATIVTILFLLISSFVVPLILLVKQYKIVLNTLKVTFTLSLIVLFLTSLGFPYSDDPKSLAPQRYMIAHSKRTFHDFSGAVEEKTGYWIVDMDSNSLRAVEKYVPEASLAESLDQDCIDYLYCGVPYLVSALTLYWKTRWIPGPEPQFQVDTIVNVTKEPVFDGTRFVVNIHGSTQMAVMISPVLGVELSEWSLESKMPLAGPKWNGRDTYFIFFGHGLQSVPLNFSMDFKVPNSHSGAIMDFAVCSQFLFGPGKSSTEFKDFVEKFPPWTAVAYWTARYESWIL